MESGAAPALVTVLMPFIFILFYLNNNINYKKNIFFVHFLKIMQVHTTNHTSSMIYTLM